MSCSRYFLVSHVCLGWSATGDPGEKVLPGVDGLTAPKTSCSVDILNNKLNFKEIEMNGNATALPDPKAGGDAHSGQGEVLGQVQVEVWPRTAGTLALRKPTVRRPLFPEIFHKLESLTFSRHLS